MKKKQWNAKRVTTEGLGDLNIKVQAVVQVTTPKEMSKAQADVKGSKLPVPQR